MIELTSGNLLAAPVEALVNPVNTVGVMGKGLALQFRTAYPASYAEYRIACARGDLVVGRVLVHDLAPSQMPRYIIQFPTKRDWHNPSEYASVETGLKALVRAIQEHGIRSIAVPPLGCGLGRLEWPRVRALIEDALGALDTVRVLVFEPR